MWWKLGNFRKCDDQGIGKFRNPRATAIIGGSKLFRVTQREKEDGEEGSEVAQMRIESARCRYSITFSKNGFYVLAK